MSRWRTVVILIFLIAPILFFVGVGTWALWETGRLVQVHASRKLEEALFVRLDFRWLAQGTIIDHTTLSEFHRKHCTEIKRTRYQADAQTCVGCPLRYLCLQGKATCRHVSLDQFEPHRERLAKRMANDEGRQKYARRAAIDERPFAVIKQYFGVCQFLLRGLGRVRMEWQWISIAFNQKKLLAVLTARAGPNPPSSSAPVNTPPPDAS